jgi:hypothetical protein
MFQHLKNLSVNFFIENITFANQATQNVINRHIYQLVFD